MAGLVRNWPIPAPTNAKAAASRRAACWSGGPLADAACACFAAWRPAGGAIGTLVAAEGRRWTIEGSFEAAKNELGLEHDESRSWRGWRPKNPAPPRPEAPGLVRWPIQGIRRVATRLAQ